MTKTIMIAGSSGMTGYQLLLQALESKEVSKVITVDRKKPNINHKKLTQVEISDFAKIKSLEKHFKNVDIGFWCIGVYTGAVDAKAFYKITVDYLKGFMELLKEQSPKATFVLMSAMGADKDSRVLFARCKGVAEKELAKMKFTHWYAARPGYIYPVIKRKEPNIMYSIFRRIYPVLKHVMKSSSITSQELGLFMLKAGLETPKQKIYENGEMKKYLRL